MKIVREISPLTQFDCFTIVSKKRADFKFVLHNHEDMELNLTLNAAGAKRIVGNHSCEISDMELVFIGPNLSHGWMMDNCNGKEIHIVTIRFQKDLLNECFWKCDPLNSISTLFENSKRGVLFSKATVAAIAPRILSLTKESGFDSVLNLLSILNYLSVSDDITLLSHSTFGAEGTDFKNDKIEKIFEFISNNYNKQISLSQLSKIANMPEVSLNNLLKKCTGYSFLDNLNELRVNHVSRMLIDTTHSIAEIAFKSGFNNLANFNRTFKNKKGITPKEFRENNVEKGPTFKLVV